MFKFGVIGLGYIGKRHVSLLSEIPEVEIVGLCDIQEDIQKEMPEKYQSLFYTDAQTMLNQINSDVICICTPNGLHAFHSLMALEAGNHVICEKPLGLDALSCIEMMDLAKEKQKNLICVLQNRYTPAAIWLKDVVDKKLLGRVFNIQVNCFWNRDERYYFSNDWRGTLEYDGGPLFTQFSHFLDILFWIFGSAQTLQHAQFRNYNHEQMTDFEDSGCLLFTLARGSDVVFNYSTSVWDKNLESSITVIGEKGSLKIGGQYLNELSYCHIKDYTPPTLPLSNPPNQYPGFQGSASNHQLVFLDMIARLKSGLIDYSIAMEASESVAFIENMYEIRKFQKSEHSFYES